MSRDDSMVLRGCGPRRLSRRSERHAGLVAGLAKLSVVEHVGLACRNKFLGGFFKRSSYSLFGPGSIPEGRVVKETDLESDLEIL